MSEQSSESIGELQARCRSLEEIIERGSDSGFLRQLIDIIPHFVFAKDREGRFTLVNRAVADAYGTTVEALVGLTDADFNANAEEVAHFRRDDLEVMDTLEEKLIPEEVITDAKGNRRWLQTVKRPIVGVNGQASHILGVATDITRHKELEEQLRHAALHDALTGLPNRIAFSDRLEIAFERSRRSPGAGCAVLFLDLDRFKLVNDGLGHRAGDMLLIDAARRLRACLPPGCTVARLGGDEFTLLLTDITSVDAALAVAESIHAAFAEPLEIEGREVYFSASIGIAYGASSYQHPEDMLRDADTAMYRAKSHHRGRHVVFDSDMHATAVSQLRVETELRRALERGELFLAYQPIVSLANGAITDFEVLLRWAHPERGTLEPEHFLRIATETGLLREIERWSLLTCFHDANAWRELPGRSDWGVSFNFSGPQLAATDLVDRVLGALAESGLPPTALRLEITETAVLERFEPVVAMLRELRAKGIGVDVDDFGTGYSSLSYLHRLPVDRLKIDRSFIHRLGQDPEAASIVSAIVGLAANLKMKVVAEGVETAAQLTAVRQLGCDQAQGFYYSAGIRAADVRQLRLAFPA